MALDLEKIKARLKKLNEKGNGNTWKPEVGVEKAVRILPTKNGDPFKDLWIHYGVGGSGPILCPQRNFNEDCPICSFASKLWKEGSKESKEAAKGYFATQRFFAPIIVREEMKEGPKIWGFSKTIYDKVLRLCLKPDYGDITDPEVGRDLSVVSNQIEGRKFPTPDFDPAGSPSKLAKTAKELKEILDKMPDMSGMFERRTTKEVEAILNQHLSPDADASAGAEKEKYGEGTAPDDVDKAFKDLTGE